MDYLKTRTITLKKKDIFFDIDMLSLSLSRVAGGESPQRTDAIATDTSTSSGTRIFTRLADRRVAELKELMQDFLNPVTQASGNDLLVASDYTITLSITSEMKDEALEPIIALMHDYVAKGALSDWYSEIGAGPVEALATQAQGSAVRIRELLYNRPIPEMQ